MASKLWPLLCAAAVASAIARSAARPLDASSKDAEIGFQQDPMLMLPVHRSSTAGGNVQAAQAIEETGNVNKPDPVRITLFVMSRCPDAQAAEARMAEVLTQVSDIAVIHTEYIAKPAHDTTPVQCKHGPQECLGNKQQLCADAFTPEEDNASKFFPFILCMNKQPDKIGTIELADACMQEVGYSKQDQEDIRECFTGEDGDKYLEDSSGYTARLGVEKSCTVYINGHHRCLLDGGRWQDCDGGSEVSDFVTSICDAYDSSSRGMALPSKHLPDACRLRPSHVQQLQRTAVAAVAAAA